MPNWCYNETIFYGDERKIYEIGTKLLEVFEKSEDKQIHFSILFDILGCSNDNQPSVRAWINGVTLEDNGTLYINYESAWNPIIESLNEVLEKYQPTLKQVTQCEECGNGIYINTDKEGLYFTDRYILDISIFGDDEERFNDFKYFVTLEGAIKEFKEFFELDCEINTLEAFEQYIDVMRGAFKECYITFEEFSLE